MGRLIKPSKTVRLYTRSEWDARAPRPTAPEPRAPDEAFVHHSDDPDAESIKSLAQQKAKMRQTQAFHMDVRGWSDIAYHYVVFQPYGRIKHARVFEGRDWQSIPAAQLNHNTGTLAVCVIGNFESDRLKDETLHAIAVVLKHAPGSHGLRVVGGHRDVVSTSCPGDNAYRRLDELAEASGLRRFH